MANIHGRRSRESGITFVEVVIVVAVLAVVTALAIPNIMNTIYNVRLRSSANTVAGMLQAVRMQAVRDNTYYLLCRGSVDGATVVWSQKGTCSTPGQQDTQAQLSQGVVFTNSGYPSPPSLGFSLLFNPSQNPAFSARGLPCMIVGSNCLSNFSAPGIGSMTAAYQLYLTDSRPLGSNGFALITVSPSGKIEVRTYIGPNWGT